MVNSMFKEMKESGLVGLYRSQVSEKGEQTSSLKFMDKHRSWMLLALKKKGLRHTVIYKADPAVPVIEDITISQHVCSAIFLTGPYLH